MKLREVKVLVEDIKADLDRENIPYDKNISVGVMIETPAASEIADLLAKEADFSVSVQTILHSIQWLLTVAIQRLHIYILYTILQLYVQLKEL